MAVYVPEDAKNFDRQHTKKLLIRLKEIHDEISSKSDTEKVQKFNFFLSLI